MEDINGIYFLLEHCAGGALRAAVFRELVFGGLEHDILGKPNFYVLTIVAVFDQPPFAAGIHSRSVRSFALLVCSRKNEHQLIIEAFSAFPFHNR